MFNVKESPADAGMGVTNNMVTFSTVKAKKPSRLAKQYRLDTAGAMIKEPGGALYEGLIRTAVVSGLREFAEELKRAAQDTAFVFGVCDYLQAIVTTQGNLERMREKRAEGDLPVIARDRVHIRWHAGPGFLMIDYDPLPGMPILSKEQLLELVYKIWPELRGAPHGWRPSSSSCITNLETGEKVHGIRGQRIYVSVANGQDIARAGTVLFQRLWQAGHGAIVISKSGAMLVRTPIDGSVWTPERLDFCGGASCEAPLTQDLPDLDLINPDEPPIDTLATLPDLSEKERAEVQRLQREAKGQDSVVKEAEAVVEIWVEECVEKAVAADPKINKEKVRQSCRRAATEHDLDGDFRIKLESGQWVTVAEIRDNPTKYHNARCADPLEPDYGNDPRIAVIFSDNSTPHIYSHAHGGQRYALLPKQKAVQLIPGQLHEVVRQALATLKRSGVIFERGGELVRVTKNAQVMSISPEWLTVALTALTKFQKRNNKDELVHVDCPLDLAKRVLAMRGEYNLPTLDAVITAPIMTSDGRILDQSGYDSSSRLLLMLEPTSLPPIPRAPTLQQVIDAIDFLLWPFKDFPFSAAQDVAVLLSTLLTAVMRPVLPTAPATLMTSPTAGSGKSLLTTCAAILAGADEPALMPPSDNEEEIRKRMLAALREGKLALLLDNLVGQLDSATLCVLLTSRNYSDRLLGSSVTLTVPTNSLIMASGNNVTLVGDLNRRFLTCSIDPKMAKAYRRSFGLNPAEYVRRNRQEMVAAALTLIQGYRTLGAPVTNDRTASFETWSDLIRQPVIWAGKVSGRDLPDPCNSFDASYEQDPESRKLESLLAAWSQIYENQSRKVQSVIRDIAEVAVDANSLMADLFDACDEIAGERGIVNPRRLGRWIEKYKGRVCGDKKFVIAGQAGGANLWQVVAA